jgi:hypothetical protein
VDRTEASIAPARGGDRTDRRHRCRVPVGRMLFVLVVVGLSLAGAWSVPTAEGATRPKSPAPGGGSQPALTLLAPPTIAGPTSPFTVRLAVSGAVPLSDLTLSVTVYSPLHDITSFDETLGGTPVGSVATGSQAPITLSSLPPDPDHQNGVDLSVPVAAGGVAGTGTGPFTVDLQCQVGSCGGVYPVRLALTDTVTDTVTSRLLTYLAYTDAAADIEPLRFALVVPMALAPGSPASGAAPAVTPSALRTLTDVMAALSGTRSTVPVTLAPSPATVAALDASRPARSALAALVALTAGTDRQTLCGPFVPVDASAVVAARSEAGTELAEQVRRGAQVLDSVPGLHTGGCADDAWVTNATLDPPALAALGGLGYNDVVIPPAAVAGPAPSNTPTRRFTLTGGPKTASAILSDPSLSALLESTSGDPALAASQLLAELELDYYEAQNTPQGRGVVAAPAPDWHPNPTVLADVVTGLEGNPMVDAVTLATLFSDVPVGQDVLGVAQPSSRRPAAVNVPTGLPVAALEAARSRWTGFSAAVSGTSAGATVATALGDFLLAAESQQLTPVQQSAATLHFAAALDQQLALLSITSRQVRLTASAGSVPITVIKNTAYPVKAVLTVTSANIAFSAGGNQVPNSECRAPVVTNSAGRSSVSTQCTFVHGTNAVYIEMRSRVSGDFRMSITLDSPEGGLQLAGGQVTVRSMSTSAVAIALSVAAGAVLLGWWGRTVRRSRRSRRGAHRQGAGDKP